MFRQAGAATGHVFRVERVNGPQWGSPEYRLPDGRQVK